MKWMKFKSWMAETVIVLNMAQAQCITPGYGGGTYIHMLGSTDADENKWHVTETIDEIGQRAEWRF